jgi:CRISPR system Cascade subunit CasE
MYLSKLQLNPGSRQVAKDQANPYELHRTLMRAFPPFDHEAERVLFRLEGRHLDEVLVQSTLAPDWGELPEDYLLAPAGCKEIGLLALHDGQSLRFRLRANPAKRDAASHKRVGLYTEDERLQWLVRKGTQHGFALQAETIVARPTMWREMKLPSGNDRKQTTAKVNVVDFDGVLTVVNPRQLQTAVVQGVGPAKGLGCGLLSLAQL